MRITFSTAVVALVLSVAVILAFATTPAMANSMQDKDKSTGSVSTPAASGGTQSSMEHKADMGHQNMPATSVKPEKKFKGEAKAGESHTGIKEKNMSKASIDVNKGFKGEAKAGANVKLNRKIRSQARTDFSREPAGAGRISELQTGSAIFFEPVTGSWGNEAMAGARIAEPTPDVFANAELGATAARDRRFAYSNRDWGVAATAGAIITEPSPDVFASAEVGPAAERDRRFLHSRFVRHIAEPTETMSAGTRVPSPGVFAPAEVGPAAERDRRFMALNRDLQKGEMPSYEGLRPLIYEGPQSEWFDPWAGVAGSGGYNYDYWFAPRHVR